MIELTVVSTTSGLSSVPRAVPVRADIRAAWISGFGDMRLKGGQSQAGIVSVRSPGSRNPSASRAAAIPRSSAATNMTGLRPSLANRETRTIRWPSGAP